MKGGRDEEGLARELEAGGEEGLARQGHGLLRSADSDGGLMEPEEAGPIAPHEARPTG